MKKVENRICLTGLTSVGNGTISNWSAISGTTPLASAVIAVQEKARLYSRGLLLNKLSMNGSPFTKKNINTLFILTNHLNCWNEWFINQQWQYMHGTSNWITKHFYLFNILVLSTFEKVNSMQYSTKSEYKYLYGLKYDELTL